MTTSETISRAAGDAAVRGNRSTLLSHAVRITVKAVSVPLLARLVTPAQHGLFAMGASIMFVLALFRDGGLGLAMIQSARLTDVQLSTLCWIQLGLGAALTVITVLLAPIAAAFFGEPHVVPLLTVMSASFFIMGVGAFPRAQLTRDLKFETINALETAGAVVGTVAMIAAAYFGAGAYAFVTFLLVSETLHTALAWRAAASWPRGPMQWRSVQDLARTGAELTAYQLLLCLVQQIDSFAVGRWFGTHALGLYNRSAQVLSLGHQHITAPLAQIAVATLARVGAASPEFPTRAARAVTLIAYFSLPLPMMCLTLPAETLRLVLGAQWHEASAILPWLAIAGAVAAINNIAFGVNLAAGQTRRLLPATILALPLLLVGLWIARSQGPTAVAAAVALVGIVLVVPRCHWTLRGSTLSSRAFASALCGPIATNVALAGGMLAGRWATTDAPWQIRLLAGLGGGVAGFGAVAAASARVRNELAEIRLHLPWRRTEASSP
jgi:O-antigen/teichoic acid export membrane protein